MRQCLGGFICYRCINQSEERNQLYILESERVCARERKWHVNTRRVREKRCQVLLLFRMHNWFRRAGGRRRAAINGQSPVACVKRVHTSYPPLQAFHLCKANNRNLYRMCALNGQGKSREWQKKKNLIHSLVPTAERERRFKYVFLFIAVYRATSMRLVLSPWSPFTGCKCNATNVHLCLLFRRSIFSVPFSCIILSLSLSAPLHGHSSCVCEAAHWCDCHRPRLFHLNVAVWNKSHVIPEDKKYKKSTSINSYVHTHTHTHTHTHFFFFFLSLLWEIFNTCLTLGVSSERQNNSHFICEEQAREAMAKQEAGEREHHELPLK